METKPTEKKKNKINVNCWENEILQERKSDRPVTVTRGLNADGPPDGEAGTREAVRIRLRRGRWGLRGEAAGGT